MKLYRKAAALVVALMALALVALTPPASAQVTRATATANINNCFPTNGVGSITAAAVRACIVANILNSTVMQASDLGANISLSGTTISVATSTTQGQFWNYPQANPPTVAPVYRLTGRTFLGGATVNDGNFYTTPCGSCAGTNFSSLDWWGQLSRNSSWGGTGIGYDGNWAQVLIEADPGSPNALLAVPTMGLAVAIEAVNAVANQTPRGMEALYFGNPSTNSQNPGWALYLEAHRLTVGAGQTFGIELEMRNSVSSIFWSPYSLPSSGSTIGLELGCGVGLSATGQFNCTVAENIAANPMPYNAGIIFDAGSLAASGPGSSYEAIGLPLNYEIQWYSGASTLAGHLRADGTGSVYAIPVGGFLFSGTSAFVPDGSVWGFATTLGTSSTTYLGGSQASAFVNMVVGGTEIFRANATGAKLTTAPTGTPAASLCLDASNNIIKKTTAGSCI